MSFQNTQHGSKANRFGLISPAFKTQLCFAPPLLASRSILDTLSKVCADTFHQRIIQLNQYLCAEFKSSKQKKQQQPLLLGTRAEELSASVNHQTQGEEGKESSKWHAGSLLDHGFISRRLASLAPPGCHLRCLTGSKRRTLCASHGKPKWWRGDQQPSHRPAEQQAQQ